MKEIFTQTSEVGGSIGTLGQIGLDVTNNAEEWRKVAKDLERQASKLKALISEIRGGAAILEG
jgi:hypothetical protein